MYSIFVYIEYSVFNNNFCEITSGICTAFALIPDKFSQEYEGKYHFYSEKSGFLYTYNSKCKV